MDEAGPISTHLAMPKSRVAPTKTVSLPGLELLAALTNARITEVRCRILNTHKRSDSVLDRQHGDSLVDQRFNLSVEDIRNEPRC